MSFKNGIRNLMRTLMLLLLLGGNILSVKAEGNNAVAPVFYYIDSAGLPLSQIKSKPLQSFIHESFVFQNSNPVWIRVSLPPCNEMSLLSFSSSMADSIILYEPYSAVQGDRVLQKNGMNSIVPVFKIPAHADTIHAWLKLVSPKELVIIQANYGSIENVLSKIESRASLMTVFVMLLFIVLLLTVVVYFISPSKLGLNFIAFAFFSFLFMFTTTGVAKLVSPELQFFIGPQTTPILSCMIISGIYLSIRVLRIHYYSRFLYKTLIVLSGIIVVGIVLHFITLELLAASIVNPIGGLVMPIYIYAAWKAWRNGKSYAAYYLVGWFVYYLVMLYLILVIFQVLPPSNHIHFITPSVSVVYFIFITSSIVSKVQYYRSEREKKEKNHLENVSKLNSILEEKVKERTLALEELNSEIATQNEELRSHREQIILLNESLEKAVEERTSELSVALMQLEKRTQDLENFSYVVSHNLRGPVASLLGLIQVYDHKNPANPSNAELVEYMRVSATGLDKVISDLNLILAVKKMSSEDRVEVNLKEVFELTKTLLATPIKESGAVVTFDACEETIRSIPAFLQNIFYNLISNAIKYSRPNHSPVISIGMKCEADHYSFTFVDNGIGMIVSDTQRDLIFKMYYRVSKSKEGKGVGLYLVKSQVESLGGTIDYHSLPGQGTTFVITLPR